MRATSTERKARSLGVRQHIAGADNPSPQDRECSFGIAEMDQKSRPHFNQGRLIYFAYALYYRDMKAVIIAILLFILLLIVNAYVS